MDEPPVDAAYLHAADASVFLIIVRQDLRRETVLGPVTGGIKGEPRMGAERERLSDPGLP
jgi:hypothetical protein